MKNTSKYNRLFCAALSGLLLCCLSAAGFAQVKSNVVASVSNPASGDSITVQVEVDMSSQGSPDDKLGSFTATLDWDPQVLDLVSHSGVLQGFTGVVNDTEADSGTVRFNGANINGISGTFNLIDLTFACVGNTGTETVLDLEYSAMASTSFASLLGQLETNDLTVILDPSVGIETNTVGNAIPEKYQLSQNYPNPFNPTTRLDISLPKAGQVSLKIYNIAGQLVATLIDDHMAAGQYQLTWDAHDDAGNQLTSGIYLYRLSAANFSETRRMILLK